VQSIHQIIPELTSLNNPTAIWLLISEACDAVSRC
jgi:hypothetical protein